LDGQQVKVQAGDAPVQLVKGVQGHDLALKEGQLGCSAG